VLDCCFDPVVILFLFVWKDGWMLAWSSSTRFMSMMQDAILRWANGSAAGEGGDG
jgi:hypothetical protein